MKKGNDTSKDSDKQINKQTGQDLPGYPSEPKTEDVYSNWKEESEINPEDLTKQKTPNEKPGEANEKGFVGNVSGRDLDVPGSELDDKQEKIGNEDEENNYYSLGGDAHNNLEEDNG